MTDEKKWPFDIVVTDTAFMAGFPTPEFKVDFADRLAKLQSEINCTTLGFGTVRVNDDQYFEIITVCRPERVKEAVRTMCHINPEVFNDVDQSVEIVFVSFTEMVKMEIAQARGEDPEMGPTF